MTEPPEETLHALGRASGARPLHVFERSAAGTLGEWVWLATVVLVCAGTVAVRFTVEPAPDRSFYVLLAGGAAVAVLIGWFWWHAYYRSTPDLVHLYEYGMAWRTARDGWIAARWTDAVAVWRYDTAERAIGPEASRVRVEFADGREVRCAAQLRDYPELAAQVQRAVHRHLFPGYKARRDAGEIVAFGPVTLTPTELVVTRTRFMSAVRYPLADVRAAGFLFGTLWLNRPQAGPDSPVLFLHEIPNFTISIALLPFVPMNWNPAAFE